MVCSFFKSPLDMGRSPTYTVRHIMKCDFMIVIDSKSIVCLTEHQGWRRHLLRRHIRRYRRLATIATFKDGMVYERTLRLGKKTRRSIQEVDDRLVVCPI
jgi:hypothetical protein